MIEYLSKNKAKLTVSAKSGKKRKRWSKTVEYHGKKELKKMYDEFERECLKPPLTDVTVSALVTSYIQHSKGLGAKGTTIHGYETAQKRIEKALPDILAADLMPYHVDDFVSEMSKKYAPKTINNTMSLLSASFKWAVSMRRLEYDPCSQVTLPKLKASEVDIFTAEQVLAFLSELENERLDLRVGYKLALLCGLRRSEILGLQEEHVNIPFKCLTISNTRHRISTDEVVQDTKSEKSHRILALPDDLVTDIDALIKEHHALDFEHSEYLIQNGFGEPLNPSTFSNRIYKIEKRADLPHVSLHDLRHTFASMLNNAHIDVARISRELGHSNPSVTLKVYTHVFGDVSESSRGIANIVSQKTDSNRALTAKEKA